jgi:hypothetical protein
MLAVGDDKLARKIMTTHHQRLPREGMCRRAEETHMDRPTAIWQAGSGLLGRLGSQGHCECQYIS